MESIALPGLPLQESTLEQKYTALKLELERERAERRAERRFLLDLLKVPASVMSASQKMTLLVIWLYVNLQVEQRTEIKSWELCEKAGQSKSTFLSNLSYLSDKKKLGILHKKRVRHEHASPDGNVSITTSLYIEPTASLYSPSSYRVEEPRNHGGPGRQKRICSVCGTPDQFDEYRSFQCRVCGQWHHEEIDVEKKPLTSLGHSNTELRQHNQQDAHFEEEATEKNTGGVAHVAEERPAEDREVIFLPVADDLSEPTVTNSKLLTERTQKNNEQVADLEVEEEQNTAMIGRGTGEVETTQQTNEKQVASFEWEEAQTTHLGAGGQNEDKVLSHHRTTTHTHRVLSPFSSRNNEQDAHAAEARLLREQFRAGLLKELQPHPQWIVWQREGERKVPYHPSGHYRASSTNPRTWGTLEQALATLSTGTFAGLGFMLAPERLPLVFIDVDHCLPNGYDVTSSLEIRDPRVFDIVHELRSYTEVSPSGNGLHILAYGHLPGASMKTPQIELYDSKRYFTVTGKHLAATPNTIEWREPRLFTLYQAHRPDLCGVSASRSLSPWEDVWSEDPESVSDNEEPLPPRGQIPSERPHSAQVATPPPHLCSSSLEVVQLPKQAERDPLLQALLRGETSMYGGDESVADYVLIMKLLHWSGTNVELTRRLFLDSPLGLREKDGIRKATSRRGELMYVDVTIQKVLRTRRNLPPSRPHEP